MADAPAPTPDAEPIPAWGVPAPLGVPRVAGLPLPGFAEARSLPYGDTAQERAAGVSEFNPVAQPTVSGVRTETPAAPERAVQNGYDNRFAVPVRVDPQAGTIERVAPPTGLQPGESAGLLPRANE